MAKKAKPKTKPKKPRKMSQKERFVAAARSVGAAEDAGAFDAAFSKVVKPNKPRP